jgi:hypothetical protein
MNVKLTKRQQEVYDAMKGGAIARYMPYMGRFGGPYWHIDHKKVTAQVQALIKRGLVETFDGDFRGQGMKAMVRK